MPRTKKQTGPRGEAMLMLDLIESCWEIDERWNELMTTEDDDGAMDRVIASIGQMRAALYALRDNA